MDPIYTSGGYLKHLIKRKHIVSRRLKKLSDPTHIQQIGQYRIHRFGSKAEIDHLTKFSYFIVCHKKEGHMSIDNLNINSTGYLVI